MRPMHGKCSSSFASSGSSRCIFRRLTNQMEDVAQAFREAACGRVVAMLASKHDVPEKVVRRLAAALEDTPRVVSKPVMRLDVCMAMMLVGALVTLLWYHIRDLNMVHSEAQSEQPKDDHEDDAVEPPTTAAAQSEF